MVEVEYVAKEKIIENHIVRKWDFKTKTYCKHQFNPAWKIIMHTDNMDEIINCCNCGKEMIFGKGYGSRMYHNSMGMGYSVCEECYSKEREMELMYR